MEYYPHLLAEWSHKNPSPPSNYSFGSRYKAWWKCSNGHEWQTAISHRTNNNNPTGCPYCIGNRRIDNWSNYPLLVEQWSEKNNLSINTYRCASNCKVWWKCDKGHEWQASIQNRTRKSKSANCPYCDGKRRVDTWEDYPVLVQQWSDRNELPINSYKCGSGYRAWWKCKAGHEWRATIYNRTKIGTINQDNCPDCKKSILGKRKREFS